MTDILAHDTIYPPNSNNDDDASPFSDASIIPRGAFTASSEPDALQGETRETSTEGLTHPVQESNIPTQQPEDVDHITLISKTDSPDTESLSVAGAQSHPDVETDTAIPMNDTDDIKEEEQGLGSNPIEGEDISTASKEAEEALPINVPANGPNETASTDVESHLQQTQNESTSFEKAGAVSDTESVQAIPPPEQTIESNIPERDKPHEEEAAAPNDTTIPVAETTPGMTIEEDASRENASVTQESVPKPEDVELTSNENSIASPFAAEEFSDVVKNGTLSAETNEHAEADPPNDSSDIKETLREEPSTHGESQISQEATALAASSDSQLAPRDTSIMPPKEESITLPAEPIIVPEESNEKVGDADLSGPAQDAASIHEKHEFEPEASKIVEPSAASRDDILSNETSVPEHSIDNQATPNFLVPITDDANVVPEEQWLRDPTTDEQLPITSEKDGVLVGETISTSEQLVQDTISPVVESIGDAGEVYDEQKDGVLESHGPAAVQATITVELTDENDVSPSETTDAIEHLAENQAQGLSTVEPVSEASDRTEKQDSELVSPVIDATAEHTKNDGVSSPELISGAEDSAEDQATDHATGEPINTASDVTEKQDHEELESQSELPVVVDSTPTEPTKEEDNISPLEATGIPKRTTVQTIDDVPNIGQIESELDLPPDEATANEVVSLEDNQLSDLESVPEDTSTNQIADPNPPTPALTGDVAPEQLQHDASVGDKPLTAETTPEELDSTDNVVSSAGADSTPSHSANIQTINADTLAVDFVDDATGTPEKQEQVDTGAAFLTRQSVDDVTSGEQASQNDNLPAADSATAEPTKEEDVSSVETSSVSNDATSHIPLTNSSAAEPADTAVVPKEQEHVDAALKVVDVLLSAETLQNAILNPTPAVSDDAVPATQIQDIETLLAAADSDAVPPQDATLDEKLTTEVSPVMHDSLLQRVHDRAFSGDSIEGLPHIAPEESDLSSKTPTLDGADEAALDKDGQDGISIAIEKKTASPELIPVPLLQDEPVLVMPELELHPIVPPPEPDVVVVSGIPDEASDREDIPTGIPEVAETISATLPLETAEVDSVILESYDESQSEQPQEFSSTTSGHNQYFDVPSVESQEIAAATSITAETVAEEAAAGETQDDPVVDRKRIENEEPTHATEINNDVLAEYTLAPQETPVFSAQTNDLPTSPSIPPAELIHQESDAILAATPEAVVHPLIEHAETPELDIVDNSSSSLEKTPLISQAVVPNLSQISPKHDKIGDDLTPSAELSSANLDSSIEIESTKSDIPEVPTSPRSELGALTPTFDTRSEISAASHEPLAPSTPRTDLTIPSSPVVSEIAEPLSGLVTGTHSNTYLASEVTSEAGVESISTSSPHDIIEVSTPTKTDSMVGSPSLNPIEDDQRPIGSLHSADDIFEQPEGLKLHVETMQPTSPAALAEAPKGEDTSEENLDNQSTSQHDDLVQTPTIAQDAPNSNVTEVRDLAAESIPDVVSQRDTSPVTGSSALEELSSSAMIMDTPATEGGPEEPLTERSTFQEVSQSESDQTSTTAQVIPSSNVIEFLDLPEPVPSSEVAITESEDDATVHVVDKSAPKDFPADEVASTEYHAITADKESETPGPKIIEPAIEMTQAQQSSIQNEPSATESESILEVPPNETLLQPFPTTQSDSEVHRSPVQIVPLPEDDKLHVPSPKSRSRLVSTASSRLLPGGWKTEYARPEGRESLEMAQGEFSPPVRDEEGKKKHRCHIM